MARIRDLYVPLAALALYTVFATREYYWDGVAFAITVESPSSWPQLFQPSHLLYCSLIRAVNHWVPVRPLYLMQALNVLLGAASVMLMSLQIRRPALTALFAFSAVWWKFTTDANAYIPAIFFLLVARTLLEKEEPAPVRIALAHTAAMLMHQLSLFFFPAALFALWRRSRRAAVVYASLAGTLTLGTYTAAFVAQSPGQTFAEWIMTHSPDASFSGNLVRGLLLSLRGTQRLLVGGKVGLFEPDLLTFAGIGLALCAVALFFRTRDPVSETRLPIAIDAIWLISYVVFLVFWLPQNTFYRLFYLPPLILLLRHIPGRRWVAVAAGLVVAWNWAFYIYPHTLPKNNAPLHFALTDIRAWPNGSIILYRYLRPDLWTMSYFSKDKVWIDVTDRSLEQLEQIRLTTARDKTELWADDSAIDALSARPDAQEWLQKHSTRAVTGRFRFTSIQ
ncbi:MAG: hypothetical protein H7039_14220 [Bryobacteraceae bacterium]|nr:hypothetical protein [Bryobacteraceae bacterium]